MGKINQQHESKSDSSKTIDALSARIGAMVLESPAITDQEIADHLKVSRQTVNRKRNSRAVRETITSAYRIPDLMIRAMVLKSISRLDALLDDPDPKIRLSTASLFMKIGQGLITKGEFTAPEVDPFSDDGIREAESGEASRTTST
jgi:hypothetical protein